MESDLGGNALKDGHLGGVLSLCVASVAGSMLGGLTRGLVLVLDSNGDVPSQGRHGDSVGSNSGWRLERVR